MEKEINGIQGRKIAILVADGVNDYLLNITKHALEAKGASTRIVAVRSGYVKGAQNKALPVDYSIHSVTSSMFDALYIPGGKKSIDDLIQQKEVLDFVCNVYSSGKNIAVDEEGMELLEASCLNHQLSSCDYNELKNNGVFVHTKSIPTVKHFIKALAADYPTNENETNIKVQALVSA